MPHFFISYAKKDTRQLALQLNEALNALQDVTAWVDKSLRAGRSWELQIQTEIDRCDYMIVLYSPDINRHKQGEEESYMLTEIAYAKYTAHKLIIPVMVQKTEPPISLTMAHYIDFTISGLTVYDLTSALCEEAGIVVGAGFIPPAASVSSSASIPTRPTSLNLMPAPFAWIDIPGKGYSIAKYPITNAQFARFIEADGYNQKKWWTDVGWAQREEHKWTQPRYWTASEWNGAERPVVGVSWYDSVAFCLWLSEVTREKIMLPTEDQWQYAAQGNDGRGYTWGKQWDASRCNNNVDGKGIGRTSPVRHYEGKGDSPFAVVDMVGNVWEWCLTDYDTKTNDCNGFANKRVVRGGSCDDYVAGYFRCDYRNFDFTFGRFTVGFRVSRVI